MPTSSLLIADTDVWTGRNEPVKKNVCLLMTGGRIAALGPRDTLSIPPDTKVVDGRGTTAIPGLCDIHVHLTTNSNYAKVVDNATYRALTTKPEKLLHGIRNGMRALAAGFTTLRVMGHRDVGEIELKTFVERGLFVGPRLLVAPWVISMTGGRGDLFYPSTWPREPMDTADGVEECRKLVRLQRKQGADFIKVTASGGMLSESDQPHWANYTIDELKVIVDEAHDYDMKVAAHAHSVEGIKRALAAGVDTLEHGSFLDEKSIEMMVTKGTFLVPTLAIADWIATSGAARGVRPDGLAKITHAKERQMQSVRMAHAAGVKIAMGTDSTGTLCPFGEHARELELYVEAGLSPMEALMTATTVAADALGLSQQIGSLEAGKVADLVMVNGDPTKDIGVLRKPGGISKVFKDGVDLTNPWPALIL
jgi:imidazolonepropionase-like amidohydrolase